MTSGKAILGHFLGLKKGSFWDQFWTFLTPQKGHVGSFSGKLPRTTLSPKLRCACLKSPALWCRLVVPLSPPSERSERRERSERSDPDAQKTGQGANAVSEGFGNSSAANLRE